MNLASYIILFLVLALWVGVLWYMIHRGRKAKKEPEKCDGSCCCCALHGMCGKEKSVPDKPRVAGK